MKLETLRKNYKNKILVGISFIFIILSIITLVTSRAKYIKTQSVTIVDNEVKFTPYDFKIMAMYKQKEDCSDTSSDACYTKMGDDERMPSEGYEINQEKSYCYVDNDNEKIKEKVYTNSKGEHVISDLPKRSKCYLYFDEQKINAATLIAKNVCVESSETITEEQAKNCLVKEKGYRFEGSDPNNYVTFNSEEWRIVGIFDVETENGTEQLIKMFKTESEEKAWDATGSNNWERPATLNTYLNNTYLNTITEKDKIASVKWNIGSTNGGTAEEYYTEETKNQTINYYEVGLINVSDYGFAVVNNVCNRSLNMGQYMAYGGVDDCYYGNWSMARGGNMWTLNPSSDSSDKVYDINAVGNPMDFYRASEKNDVRPAIYLKSNISLSEGTGEGEVGSKTNPYVIE